MPRRHRQHVNPFSLEHLSPREEPLSLPKDLSLEVELGCGDGLFTVERAAQSPGTYHLGIDIRRAFLRPGKARIEELGLENVRLELANLMIDLPGLFPPQRVDRFLINFPDPFFKRKQHNRRWLTAESLSTLVLALRSGGELIYQSDVWETTVEALGLLELERQLENTLGPFSFSRKPLVAEQTSREKSCLARGLKIWRLRYRKA